MTNDERRMLEMAAKAAGMESRWDSPRGSKHGVIRARPKGEATAFPVWNPKDDNGDALRLAVACRITVQYPWDDNQRVIREVRCWNSSPEHFGESIESWNGDVAAATRLAITRAAAAIGEAMP